MSDTHRIPSYHHKPNHKAATWVLFGLIVLAMAVDFVVSKNGNLARGVFLGALLCYIMQSVFAIIAHRNTHPKYAVSALYQAAIVKWLIALMGFALIFGAIAHKMTIATGAVFIGFVLMQVALVVVYSKTK